jgi:hypothetical protein
MQIVVEPVPDSSDAAPEPEGLVEILALPVAFFVW